MFTYNLELDYLYTNCLDLVEIIGFTFNRLHKKLTLLQHTGDNYFVNCLCVNYNKLNNNLSPVTFEFKI